ncbi:hypothetical protein KIPB_010413 [Kipferlia bialata]|uniref:Uncharacterized protein n=1 Tax=Kipferlia bialata TaxID=797122 RepID=A0A391NYT4_9EUKA|nr:hypothetical protein KIPB_010413 [Kipferlia bialata]|eukprot:g10413.t1
MKQHRSQFQRQLRLRHPRAGLQPDSKYTELVVSAPENAIDHIMNQVRQKLASASPEDVLVGIPSGVSCPLMASKLGPLRKELSQVLSESYCELLFNVCVVFEQRSVKITVVGEAKCQLALLVGRVHSFLAAQAPHQFTLSVSGSGRAANEVNTNPRYRQLASSVTPQHTPGDRNSVMLMLVHHLIWATGCSVYGGFVRDWVIRGKEANDIDCLLPSMSQLDSVKASLIGCAKHLGLQWTGEVGHPNSYMVSFSGAGMAPISVDLVDPHLSSPPPHCECSAANVKINEKGVMAKKAYAGGDLVTLADCVSHIQSKSFVCFIDWGCAANTTGCDNLVRRVKRKYLDRGWSLLNRLPTTQMQRLQGMPEYRGWQKAGQLHFDPKYTGMDWANVFPTN